MPRHLLDSLGIGEAGGVGSQAQLALESLPGALQSLLLHWNICLEWVSLMWRTASVCTTWGQELGEQAKVSTDLVSTKVTSLPGTRPLSQTIRFV